MLTLYSFGPAANSLKPLLALYEKGLEFTPRFVDPTKFEHVFVFRDQDAERIHSSSAAVERFTAVLYPECLQAVVFTDMTLVASTESRP